MSSGKYQCVWLKVVEAKDLKAADSNGLSDPYVTLTRTSERGKKLGELKTPVVKKTLNPQWHSEFVFQVFVEPVEAVELRVYDWNRIAGNKVIGQTKLKLEFPPDELQDTWVQLDTKGAVRLLALLSDPFPPPDYPRTIPHKRLPHFHLQVERRDYFTGESIRGALVLNLAKPTKKPYQLSIRVESVSHSSVKGPNGEKLDDSHYFMDYEANNITVPGTKPGEPCPPGLHIIPFQVALPLTLPPSFWARYPTSSGSSFQIIADFDVDGKDPINDAITFKLHSSALNPEPCISTPDPELHHPDKNPYPEPKCIATASGPMQLVAGQTATYRCRITNWTSTPIDYLEMSLVWNVVVYARDSSGKWHSQSSSDDSTDLKFVDGPGPNEKALQPPNGFPVAAGGGQWEGNITVAIPKDSEFSSISPSASPLVTKVLRLVLRPKARRDNGPEPAPRAETKALSRDKCAPEPMIVDVLEARDGIFPKPSPPFTSSGTSDGLGPIYLYLEPFQESQTSGFDHLARPKTPSIIMDYWDTDLSPLFQRAIPPSPSAKNTHWIKPSAEKKQIPAEEWSPGKLPSWLK